MTRETPKEQAERPQGTKQDQGQEDKESLLQTLEEGGGWIQNREKNKQRRRQPNGAPSHMHTAPHESGRGENERTRRGPSVLHVSIVQGDALLPGVDHILTMDAQR